ncbi:DUF3168 domain-containing protein [Sulfitobacter aestuariivivens]|uniref:DUF3168 domain-containing protein n=1 Tax=Sulfitobacter aestuariivivens TaxID=2766981 RepID=A0A927D201_9RHOB|nr:DUF3168 domain-containing protein [Sulfitobacter aestuariivivens]MBD3662931.1 DUF3168 domain-containing protein [Sulfitobacter aestuariivivens]
MTFALSGPLQAAVYAALSADAALAALVGGDVFDAVPSGTVPARYVLLGSETVTDASDLSASGAMHRFTVSVITSDPGFSGAKAIAGQVSDVLHDADLSLTRGSLVALRFERATAKRTNGGATRQIDLRFRARVDDTAA